MQTHKLKFPRPMARFFNLEGGLYGSIELVAITEKILGAPNRRRLRALRPRASDDPSRHARQVSRARSEHADRGNRRDRRRGSTAARTARRASSQTARELTRDVRRQGVDSAGASRRRAGGGQRGEGSATSAATVAARASSCGWGSQRGPGIILAAVKATTAGTNALDLGVVRPRVRRDGRRLAWVAPDGSLRLLQSSTPRAGAKHDGNGRGTPRRRRVLRQVRTASEVLASEAVLGWLDPSMGVAERPSGLDVPSAANAAMRGDGDPAVHGLREVGVSR